MMTHHELRKINEYTKKNQDVDFKDLGNFLLKCFLVFVAILTDSPLCSPSLEGVCSLERVSTFVSLCHNASSIPLKHPSWPRPSRHNCLINAPAMPGINAAILARQLGWRPGLMLLWNRNWRNNTVQLIIKQIIVTIFSDFYRISGILPMAMPMAFI